MNAFLLHEFVNTDSSFGVFFTHWFLLLLDLNYEVIIFRRSPLQLFLGKGVLKVRSKFTGEHPCQSAISIKLQSNCVKITLWAGCSPVNLLHIFRTPFPKYTSGGLLLCFWTFLNAHPLCNNYGNMHTFIFVIEA